MRSDRHISEPSVALTEGEAAEKLIRRMDPGFVNPVTEEPGDEKEEMDEDDEFEEWDFPEGRAADFRRAA